MQVAAIPVHGLPNLTIQSNLLNQTRQTESLECLFTSNGRLIPASHAAYKVFQLRAEFVNVASVDFFNQTILTVKYLSMLCHTVSGCLTVDQDFIVEKVCLSQRIFAMGSNTANFAVSNFASCKCRHNAIGKTQCGSHVI